MDFRELQKPSSDGPYVVGSPIRTASPIITGPEWADRSVSMCARVPTNYTLRGKIHAYGTTPFDVDMARLTITPDVMCVVNPGVATAVTLGAAASGSNLPDGSMITGEAWGSVHGSVLPPPVIVAVGHCRSCVGGCDGGRRYVRVEVEAVVAASTNDWLLHADSQSGRVSKGDPSVGLPVTSHNLHDLDGWIAVCNGTRDGINQNSKVYIARYLHDGVVSVEDAPESNTISDLVLKKAVHAAELMRDAFRPYAITIESTGQAFAYITYPCGLTSRKDLNVLTQAPDVPAGLPPAICL